jgi:hypothetical protein
MRTRRDSGRKGGLTTLTRYGKAQLREWGRLGGRPRNPDYGDIRQRQVLEKQNNEEVTGPPGNLSQLRRLFKLQAAGRAANQIQEAGAVPKTPRGQSLPKETRSPQSQSHYRGNGSRKQTEVKQ